MPPEPRPARILIAEDTPQAAELLEVYLSDGNYVTRIASDGEEAMREIADWQPDLVLLDVMMPRISGFEVCKRLRGEASTRQIGVLMITALDQPSDIDRAVEAGTDDMLSKPINRAELLRRIEALLGCMQHTNDLDRALAYIENAQKSTGQS